MSDLEVVDWFAIRVRFQRAERAAKERLNKPDIEVFLPMEVKSVATKNSGVCVKPVPIFSNLIFVKSSFQRVSELCAAYKDMFYLSETINGLKKAIRIPEDQMTTFIEFIAGNYDNIDCKMTKLKSGEKIVVKSGIFKGSKIVYKEVKGKTNKDTVLKSKHFWVFFMHKFCWVQKKFLPLAIPKENSERLFEPMFILQRICSLWCILSLF